MYFPKDFYKLRDLNKNEINNYLKDNFIDFIEIRVRNPFTQTRSEFVKQWDLHKIKLNFLKNDK